MIRLFSTIADRATGTRLGADERLVLDPMRLERLGPACRGDPVGVRAPRALEPPHLRVALEGEDVRCHAVEEPAVVRDDDRAAGEIEQRVLERAERVDVEVVRRLVGGQGVAPVSPALREVDAIAFAARKLSDRLLLVAAAKVEPAHVLARVELALA